MVRYQYEPSGQKYVNPYNFVSLENECAKNVVYGEINGDLTGVIRCEMETLTPLCIPNASYNLGSEEDKKYDFFSYEDLSAYKGDLAHFTTPIIPGSSLRGAIRGAFEAVTNSCLSTADDENVLHRRSSSPKTPGILEKCGDGIYKLYDAERVKLHTRGGSTVSHRYTAGRVLKTGDEIKFNIDSDHIACDIDKTNAMNTGIVLIGEDGPNKKYDSVMIRGKLKKVIDQCDYDRLVAVWQRYKNDKKKDAPLPYPNFLKLDKMPIFYSEVGGTYYLSPACITKEVFSRTILDVLKNQGNYQPCGSANEKICEACALFGMVGEDESGSLHSLLEFRDGIPLDFDSKNKEEFFEEIRQLPILGSPKTSATEFYMLPVEGYEYWNYDYAVKYDQFNNPIQDKIDPKVRGRKFYWHKKSLTPAGEADRADLTAKVRAVKAGKRFEFDIAFDRITEEELGKLLWVLTFGENDLQEPVHAHKLGHGKPVGYGSVRIHVNDIKKYKLNDKFVYVEEPFKMEDFSYQPEETRSIKEFLKITDYANAPAEVDYPVSADKNDAAIYKWFGFNKDKKIDIRRPAFIEKLPTPLADPLTVDGQKKVSTVDGGNNRSRNERRSHTNENSWQNRAAHRGVASPGNESKAEIHPEFIGELLQAQKKSDKTAKIYIKSKLESAISQSKYNKMAIKLLIEFVADYESSPEQYGDLKHIYQKAKALNLK